MLLVDDEESYLEIARMLLQAEDDLAVVTARDGRCALHLLDVLEPDVILTDMMMPVLDGFAFLREYKQRPNAAPVIAASALVAYLAHARELGADAVLPKPFDAVTLIRTVREVLARREPEVSTGVIAIDDETRRLQAILDLQLDRPAPEPGLQKFVEQVAAHFEVPIALFSVVTADSQFWTAGCGIPENLSEARGTSRVDSFCTHSVAARAALVVQDTLENPFFRHNILVEQRGLRFYAGVPLFGRHGEALGTLCVLDGKPHTFTHCDLELLTVFGRRVISVIEWREHVASPGIPVGTFRHLNYIDRELD
ncbi:MAG TPA: response regulator, partial [Enhygromyxa sp.]|nr:response regulator [Enhygromyxa sp.]